MSRSRTFRAPGRVNLIGEHTDYNLGFVMPIALDMAAYVETEPSSDGRLHLSSAEREDSQSWTLAEVASAKPHKHWTDYVIGVAQQLIAHGFEIRPLRLQVRSDVPEGSGLSSSAALEVSSALALLDGRDFDRLEIAKSCKKAENDFVGMPCGIMDQYVSVFGEKGKAIKIDCRRLTHEAVTLPEGGEIIAVNSRVKHELGNTAYRTRVEECEIAVDSIKRRFPEVQSLRDAKPEHLEQVQMPRVVMRRARHVISEDSRVNLFESAAARGDLDRMGQLFIESHRSMQHDYEITCDEIDFLVDTAIGIPGVYGARMTGGGFGGCTVNLVAPEAADRFTAEMRRRYQERFKIDPDIYHCHPASGAGEVA